MNSHQQNQIKVIDQVEELINKGSTAVSAVTPIEDFENDPRITLTSIHIPRKELKDSILEEVILPLKEQFPGIHFFADWSLHITIKNIQVISDPPTFGKEEIDLAKQVFGKVIPKHKQFNIYFYRLLLTQNSIALVGTTDEELDQLIFDLDRELVLSGIPDNKMYANKKHFFCNMTIARFSQVVTPELKNAVIECSNKLSIKPYLIDIVNLVSGNAVMNFLQIHQSFELKK